MIFSIESLTWFVLGLLFNVQMFTIHTMRIFQRINVVQCQFRIKVLFRRHDAHSLMLITMVTYAKSHVTKDTSLKTLTSTRLSVTPVENGLVSQDVSVSSRYVHHVQSTLRTYTYPTYYASIRLCITLRNTLRITLQY